eukprot:gnl/MRDRNA2_/MRDRNA2_56806_c0_seq1.p1 gnl/MRDRNA2_/MRDRNA2_56806_c0~~gnl/MRDRNA2_/MRDRNA2_56806_c0_seq1.p1  ORF type:complete len:236 (+),score=23.37 gnl/MRDRNA2_/MRDRNA2_56806_c0_seq1:52-759(+)
MQVGSEYRILITFLLTATAAHAHSRGTTANRVESMQDSIRQVVSKLDEQAVNRFVDDVRDQILVNRWSLNRLDLASTALAQIGKILSRGQSLGGTRSTHLLPFIRPGGLLASTLPRRIPQLPKAKGDEKDKQEELIPEVVMDSEYERKFRPQDSQGRANPYVSDDSFYTASDSPFGQVQEEELPKLPVWVPIVTLIGGVLLLGLILSQVFFVAQFLAVPLLIVFLVRFVLRLLGQ